MSRATYFVQECPTCGRRLQVRVWYLGKKVVCQHCGGQLIAADPDGEPVVAAETQPAGPSLLERADELLATADAWKRRPR
ncbi:MAG: response regulator [Pirellulaceae bacterium]